MIVREIGRERDRIRDMELEHFDYIRANILRQPILKPGAGEYMDHPFDHNLPCHYTLFLPRSLSTQHTQS